MTDDQAERAVAALEYISMQLAMLIQAIAAPEEAGEESGKEAEPPRTMDP